MTTSLSTKSFTAEINTDRLMSTVGRYFRADMQEIIGELFQNARRAGSTRIDVTVTGDRLIVSDDGRGIDDPRKLLTLADTGWDKELAESEDAAGAGFLSLSSRQVVVHSRDFRLTLDPEAFAGKRPVLIEEADDRTGTEISILLNEGECHRTENAIKRQALYLPIPVTLNGVSVTQADFLAGAAYVHEWRGVKIGVWRGDRPRPHYDCGAKLDFHGLLVGFDLPAILDASLTGTSRAEWSAHIQIVNAPWLKLVLPTRRSVVESPVLDELRREVKRALYLAIRRHGSHRLRFEDWREARDVYGIELPEALPLMQPWSPINGDGDNEFLQPVMVTDIEHPVAVASLEPHEAQALAYASSPAVRARLVEAIASDEGYSWYPERQLGEMIVTARTKEGEHTLMVDAFGDPLTMTGLDGEALLPDPAAPCVEEIRLKAEILASGKRVETISGTIPAYAAASESVDQTCWWAVRGQKDAAFDLLWDSTFCYCDNSESDSYDTQSENYRRSLRETLARAFDGEVAPYAVAVEDAINALWLHAVSPARIVIDMAGGTVKAVRFLNADGAEINALPKGAATAG